MTAVNHRKYAAVITEFLSDSRESLYQSVAEQCAEKLVIDVEQRGAGIIVVPGGTTPAPVFELLSKMPLPWNKISIIPSDERWIDKDHQQSNQYLIEKTLLINCASEARFIPLKNNYDSPEEGEVSVDSDIKKLNPPFSVTLLGMGLDGHFASLFPGCPQIAEALDVNQTKGCIAINAEDCAVAGEFTQRMSLTMSTLINSQVVILLITGQQKLDVIHQSSFEQTIDRPVSVLLAQTKTPVRVYWAE